MKLALSFNIGNFNCGKEKQPTGKLIDSKTSKVIAEEFSPMEKQLNTGIYWMDSHEGVDTRYKCRAKPSDTAQKADMIDDHTRELIKKDFRPTEAQIDFGEYWLN